MRPNNAVPASNQTKRLLSFPPFGRHEQVLGLDGRVCRMGDFWTASVVLVLVLASSAVGLFLQTALRERHRGRETTDAVRIVISILVTFTALVLSLVTSSVKSSYDQFDSRLRGYASDVTQLDQRMREYGDAADPIRAALRTYVAAAIADTWREEPRPAGV
jgi:hypothetical protein